MAEETRTREERYAYRAGKKAIHVFVAAELHERVTSAAAGEDRTLTAFVERALKAHVDLAERYAADAAPGRARRRG